METRKYTDLDPNQISRSAFDPELEANRVVIVGTDAKIDLKLGDLNIPAPIVNIPEQKVIEIPVIIKEIQVVEVPKYIEHVKIEQISVPTIVEIPKIIEVQKPIIIKEVQTEIRKVEVPVIIQQNVEIIPKWVYFIIGLQTLLLIATFFMRGK
jgi:hypothetical protein